MSWGSEGVGVVDSIGDVGSGSAASCVDLLVFKLMIIFGCLLSVKGVGFDGSDVSVVLFVVDDSFVVAGVGVGPSSVITTSFAASDPRASGDFCIRSSVGSVLSFVGSVVASLVSSVVSVVGSVVGSVVSVGSAVSSVVGSEISFVDAIIGSGADVDSVVMVAVVVVVGVVVVDPIVDSVVGVVG